MALRQFAHGDVEYQQCLVYLAVDQGEPGRLGPLVLRHPALTVAGKGKLRERHGA